ncbi:MAG: hypothetical protein R2824_00175 [Saprospiraceae bacterium]|nr:hypothetical protein [Lewinella sp.]
MTFKRTISRHLTNYTGWRINRKIVVIESDDWGTIRCPDKKDHDLFLASFSSQIRNPYLLVDTLASSQDLDRLFNLISKYRDWTGTHPLITFNTVVANPDFQKIRESGYQHYYLEPFTSTLLKYSKHQHSFRLWKEAIQNQLMFPQFHGREHVNVPIWLALLQGGNEHLIKAFSLNNWSPPHQLIGSKIKLQASLDYQGEQPREYQQLFIEEGLDLFQEIFGFSSKTMIANNFIIHPNLLPVATNRKIEAMQGMKYQMLPYGSSHSKNRVKVRRYTGKQRKDALINLVRNCVFEPAQTKDYFDDVDSCMADISNAFRWKKPAIITTHRLNYIGHLKEENAAKNIRRLEQLIKKILGKWPDVEFFHSAGLADLIAADLH